MLNHWLPCKIPFDHEMAVCCRGTSWEERVIEESEYMLRDMVSSGPSSGEGDDDRELELGC